MSPQLPGGRPSTSSASALGRSSPSPAVPDVVVTTEGDVDRLLLQEVLAQLPPRCLETIIFRYVLDLPVEDVAARLGVGVSTAKTQLKLGLRRLRTLEAKSRDVS